MTNKITRILFLSALVLSFGPSLVEKFLPCTTQDSKAWMATFGKTFRGDLRADPMFCVVQVHQNDDEALRRLDEQLPETRIVGLCPCTVTIYLDDYGTMASTTFDGCDDQSIRLLGETLTVAGPFPLRDDPICQGSPVRVFFSERGSLGSMAVQIDRPFQ